jgi:hypothetical protein
VLAPPQPTAGPSPKQATVGKSTGINLRRLQPNSKKVKAIVITLR